MIAAPVATATWYVAITYAIDLTDDVFIVSGSVLLFVVGLILMASNRTRRLGVGIAVGTALAFDAEIVILVSLFASGFS